MLSNPFEQAIEPIKLQRRDAWWPDEPKFRETDLPHQRSGAPDKPYPELGKVLKETNDSNHKLEDFVKRLSRSFKLLDDLCTSRRMKFFDFVSMVDPVGLKNRETARRLTASANLDAGVVADDTDRLLVELDVEATAELARVFQAVLNKEVVTRCPTPHRITLIVNKLLNDLLAIVECELKVRRASRPVAVSQTSTDEWSILQEILTNLRHWRTGVSGTQPGVARRE